MAIQPPYARAILTGAKTVEFRKRPLASDVGTVLIYETTPTQQVVGMFTVADTVRLTPSGLWRRFGSVGSIARPDFMSYYAEHEQAVALVVGSVVRFAVPVRLGDLRPRPAVPQSFSYLPADVLTQITSLQTASSSVETQASARLISV